MAEALKGQVAIITGGRRGIGLAIAKVLATDGVAVALVARSAAAVHEASEAGRSPHQQRGERRCSRPDLGDRTAGRRAQYSARRRSTMAEAAAQSYDRYTRRFTTGWAAE